MLRPEIVRVSRMSERWTGWALGSLDGGLDYGIKFQPRRMQVWSTTLGVYALSLAPSYGQIRYVPVPVSG